MVEAQDIAAGPFTPARDFGRIENVPNWKDVDPRFGVAYDLFGNGKTAVKASIGRYVVARSYNIARPVKSGAVVRQQRHATWAPGRRSSGTFNPFNDCDLDEFRGQQQASRAVSLRRDQQPAVRPGGHPNDQLRSRTSSSGGACGRTTGRCR